MSLTCFSHTKNCTLENALLWGMCRSHFHQVRIQSQLVSKIVHLALAIIEAIPVIGQIVSLIELLIIRAHTPPQPTSCIPRMVMVSSQESPNDVRRVWPKDLNLLGLTEDQKVEIDTHVRDACRTLNNKGELSFKKKRLVYRDGFNSVNVDAVLPITLAILKKNTEYSELSVLLFPKTVFASGGERTIRWVYDLTNGTFLLKKRIVGLFEEKILNYLLPLRINRGIQTSLMWRSSSNKRQVIEPVRDGTLATLFGTAPLCNFSAKYDLIVDLLTDLNALHAGHLSGVTIKLPIVKQEELPPYATFHSDIKPLNVLVSFQNGKWRAELCDFGGAAAHPTAFIISIGFTPPEYISFYKKQSPFGINDSSYTNNSIIADFNIKHGRGRDVWCMGLVILTLLVEREQETTWKNVFEESFKKAKIPPLPCLKRILSGHLWVRYEEEGILNLKQETLDADLDQLEREVAPKYPEERAKLARIFAMLKGMMLRIDPEERKTITQSLAFLQQ